MVTAKDARWGQGVSQLLGTLGSQRTNLALLLASTSVLATEVGWPLSHHDWFIFSGWRKQKPLNSQT